MRETTIQKKHLYTVRANGTPKGQPRPRAFVRGNRAAVYDPGTAEGWKSAIAVACAELEGEMIESPLSVDLTFFMPRPKSHFKKSGQLKDSAPTYLFDKKPDADNLAKAVLDALTAIRVWKDDDQVCELTVRKYYEGDHAPRQHTPPGCVIRIAELSEIDV